MTEIKGGKGTITFSFKADALVDPNKIPEVLAKHKKRLSFSANGRVPTFTYLYTPETLVEKEEQNLMALTTISGRTSASCGLIGLLSRRMEGVSTATIPG